MDPGSEAVCSIDPVLHCFFAYGGFPFVVDSFASTRTFLYSWLCFHHWIEDRHKGFQRELFEKEKGCKYLMVIARQALVKARWKTAIIWSVAWGGSLFLSVVSCTWCCCVRRPPLSAYHLCCVMYRYLCVRRMQRAEEMLSNLVSF